MTPTQNSVRKKLKNAGKLGDDYISIVTKKEKISKDIIKAVQHRMIELVALTQKQWDIGNKLYEFLGDDVEKLVIEKNRKYQEMLYELTDGVIFGYNMSKKQANKWAKEIKNAF